MAGRVGGVDRCTSSVHRLGKNKKSSQAYGVYCRDSKDIETTPFLLVLPYESGRGSTKLAPRPHTEHEVLVAL